MRASAYPGPRAAVRDSWGLGYFAARNSGMTAELLRGFLRHRRRVARDRGASHVARLPLVVAPAAMHGLAVVPHDEVVELPLVRVDEARLRGVLGEIAQQDARIGHRHADDPAGVRGQI